MAAQHVRLRSFPHYPSLHLSCFILLLFVQGTAISSWRLIRPHSLFMGARFGGSPCSAMLCFGGTTLTSSTHTSDMKPNAIHMKIHILNFCSCMDGRPPKNGSFRTHPPGKRGGVPFTLTFEKKGFGTKQKAASPWVRTPTSLQVRTPSSFSTFFLFVGLFFLTSQVSFR